MSSQGSEKVTRHPSQLIIGYLSSHSEVFRELEELRSKVRIQSSSVATSRILTAPWQGWANTEADEHFQKQRQRADEAGPIQRKNFFKMMCAVGNEIQANTGAIGLKSPAPRVLDLCAAPGGFIATALEHNPKATVCGISLPRTDGGHPLLVPHGRRDARVTVEFLDITMLGDEFGVDSSRHNVPALSSHRPYHGQSFDLVFCDGQVLRTHDHGRHDLFEARRLVCSQMILGLQRIWQGGR